MLAVLLATAMLQKTAVPQQTAPPKQTSAGQSDGSDIQAINLEPVKAHNQIIPFGTAKNPAGHMLTVTETSLQLDGKPWLPMMGEFHFSRYPAAEWKRELLKMKMGGIDIVSTYVFWNHHEEIEGQWDWSGQRNLREFIRLAGEVGLKVFLRIGPWCHGEVRYGGLPDWVQNSGAKIRSTDPKFLAQVKPLYQQIFTQAKGQLWKDGGPIIGVQIENEYGGQAEYLLDLKQMAIDAGFDVPIMTRTGWNETDKPLPYGALIPVYGDYAEGFWDRELTSMPDGYWKAFTFQKRPNSPILQTAEVAKQPKEDQERYPFLTCELGGGMETSYHRRILSRHDDAYSMALVKLGSGANLLGFYMYHGGTNPDGKLSTLQESQATGYWNDVPVKSYDFQTAIGEAGQIRDQYHSLRLLSLFMHDFGAELAAMPSSLPTEKPKDKADVKTLRWAVRSDGKTGFVFVNNYQRAAKMPEKDMGLVRTNLGKNQELIVGPDPVPADSMYFFPYNLKIGGVTLTSTTTQPICKSADGKLFVFSERPGISPDFMLPGEAQITKIEGAKNMAKPNPKTIALFPDLRPSHRPILELKGTDGKAYQILLLSPQEAFQTYKAHFQGKDRIFISKANLIVQENQLEVESDHFGARVVYIYPPVKGLSHVRDGIFQKVTFEYHPLLKSEVKVTKLKKPGPLRTVKLGSQGVAEAPNDADFVNAALYKVVLPKNVPPHALLKIYYYGDAARLYAGHKLVTDNFYNGLPFEVNLDRLQAEYPGQPLTLEVLPMQLNAPIYIDAAMRDFLKSNHVEDGTTDVAIDVVPYYRSNLTIR